jgi:hypothetical protein
MDLQYHKGYGTCQRRIWGLGPPVLFGRKKIRELNTQRFRKAPDGREAHVGASLLQGRQAWLWDVDEFRQVGLRKAGRFARLSQSGTKEDGISIACARLTHSRAFPRRRFLLSWSTHRFIVSSQHTCTS